MAYVNLGSMPSAKREYVVDFPQLNGGLNLQELDYRIANDESPEMKNLLWRDGILCCRRGQAWVSDTELGEYHSSYDSIWNGKLFVHAGNKIYAVDPETGESEIVYIGSIDMDQHGTFFPYNERLYYKTKGYYVEIEYDDDNFIGGDVEPYVPVTYINCSYINGSGQAYQPENRISEKKTLWYDAAHVLRTEVTGGLSAVTEDAFFRMRINTPGTYVFTYTNGWTFGGEDVNTQDYGITVGGTPENGDTITITYSSVNEYQLPIDGASVTDVTVDGVSLNQEFVSYSSSTTRIAVGFDKGAWRTKVTESGTYAFIFDYDAEPSSGWKLNGEIVNLSEYGITPTSGEAFITDDTITVVYTRGGYYLENNKVYFFTAPRVYYPEITNTIHITYEAENEIAYNNIMDCGTVAVYGGTGSLCIVMAGSETQPNAYFWNGQTSVAMDPSYFPMTQYQLAGDVVDPVRGFGKQQGYLIIFKNRSTGRTSIETQEVDGRTTISLPYTPINAKIGCDLPWTIQLIENNLTWCNTEQGVHFLANTSSAYENNIVCISQKVESSNSRWTTGLLDDVREKGAGLITSHDDGKRYWLIVDSEVWLWDYSVSNYKNPAWFYFDKIPGLGFIQSGSDIWHFDAESRLTKFIDYFTDYDGPIDKVYRFATQYFGTYDNNKNVNSVIINMRPSTNSVVDVTYITDYERRKDRTPLSAVAWSLVPRDLSFRNLAGSGFAKVFRRKPHCRRVQFFTMKLENNTKDMDMAIVSAQIYYIFQGRYR